MIRERCSGGEKKGIHYVGKLLIPFLGTDFLACSQLAGEWMYPTSVFLGQRYHLAINAIDLNKYRFNPVTRKSVRNKLQIGEKTFCIGHIGRFSYQKNHNFLLRTFAAVHKECPNSCLLLIGGHMNGDEYYEEAQDLVRQLHLEKAVHFLGIRKDVPDLLQTIDCFVLPSRFEGLPIVGIEAQVAGVPCVVSDVISRELDITGMVKYCSLDDISVWVDSIFKSKKEKIDRKTICYKGYDIENEIKKMEQFYLTIN